MNSVEPAHTLTTPLYRIVEQRAAPTSLINAAVSATDFGRFPPARNRSHYPHLLLINDRKPGVYVCLTAPDARASFGSAECQRQGWRLFWRCPPTTQSWLSAFCPLLHEYCVTRILYYTNTVAARLFTVCGINEAHNDRVARYRIPNPNP